MMAASSKLECSEPEERQALIQLGSGAPTSGKEGDLYAAIKDAALFNQVEISTRKKGLMEFYIYVFQRKGSQPSLAT